MPQQHEELVTGQEATLVAQAAFHEDGTINDAFFEERFGIGPEEATQEVTFGSYNGTVAQMLTDERCPVGGMVSSAYEQGGIAGVAEKFRTLSQLDSSFSVTISPSTFQREQVKKK